MFKFILLLVVLVVAWLTKYYYQDADMINGKVALAIIIACGITFAWLLWSIIGAMLLAV